MTTTINNPGSKDRQPMNGEGGQLSANLPPGFDPAAELARLKGSEGLELDDAEQSYAPQHQSDDAVAAAGNSEAESIVDKAALRATMNSMPPNQWTPEMKALDTEMNENPGVKGDIDGALKNAATREVDGPSITARTSSVAGVQTQSTDTRSEFFASAPQMAADYRQALAAKEPLDAEKPKIQIAAAAPVTQSNTPVAPATSPGAGFDV